MHLFESMKSLNFKLSNSVKWRSDDYKYRLKMDLEISKKLSQLIPDDIVRNGPFKGMLYKNRTVIGSAVYPKLIGSYESELNEIWNNILKIEFSTIVDIGCADGYYAVGLSRLFKNSIVYGIDIDSLALEKCKELADLNEVNVNLIKGIDTNGLLNLDLSNKSLIISDCEGFELDLFQDSIFQNFGKHYFLIECHDLFNLNITETLLNRSKYTHKHTIISSTDDIFKAYFYDYPELVSFSLNEKFQILKEGRKAIMFWLYLEPID